MNYYNTLELLLANSSWKKANKETQQLMMKWAKCEEKEWLDREGIKKIDLAKLRRIDTLWMDASNKHFGFSIQKQIYLELDETREPNKEVYNKFAKKVGWRINNKWLNHKSLIWNLESPRGHLPSFGTFFYNRFYQEGIFNYYSIQIMFELFFLHPDF